MNVETERCKVCGAPLFYTAIFFPVMLKMLTFAGNTKRNTKISKYGSGCYEMETSLRAA